MSNSNPDRFAMSTWRLDCAAVLLLILVWAIMWCATEPIGEFPLNDDWTYAHSVISLLDEGRIRINFTAANFFAQVYWGALFCLPFGFSFLALRVSTCVLAAVAIIAFYLLLREVGGTRWSALVGALTLAANPLYLSLSTSFMTDVPFIALFAVSLWLYVRGVQRGRTAAIAGAFGIALIALLIRQFALLLLLAYGVSYLFRNPLRVRALAWAALPFLFGVATQMVYPRWLIATGRGSDLMTPTSNLLPQHPLLLATRTLEFPLKIAPYIGLFMMPLVASVALGPLSTRLSQIWHHPGLRLLSIAVALVVSGVLFATGNSLPNLGNVLTPWGLGPLLLRDTYLLGLNQPHTSPTVQVLWDTITALSVWAATLIGMLLACTLVDSARIIRQSNVWLLALMLTVLFSYSAVIILESFHTPIYDRYLLPLILPLGVLLLANHSRATSSSHRRSVWQAAPWLSLIAYALFSIPAAHDYMAWNRARWRAISFLLNENGVSPREIDGGYEFNGWFLYAPGYRPRPDKSHWWVYDDKYLIAAGPLDGYEVIAQFSPEYWLGLSEAHIFVLRQST